MSERDEMLQWLGVQLARAEEALKAREDMQKAWAGGTSASWRAAGCKKSKAERLKESEMQGRIAVHCRRNVEMFKAVICEIYSVNLVKEKMKGEK